MKKKRSIIKPEILDWLLEEGNPSARYLTLRDILGKKSTDTDVMQAKKAIMKNGPGPRILARQNKEGYWEKPESFYSFKYKGTVWQLIFLAELGADAGDARIKKACEFILKHSQDPQSGGFAHRSVKSGGGDPDLIIPCLTGNMTYCLLRFGYLDDPRVRRALDFITTYQRFDDGEAKRPAGWPYERYQSCWGRHTCLMAVVKSLKALAQIPPRRRTQSVKQTMEKAVEYLLKHHIYKQSHNLHKIAKHAWTKFGFPLMWQTDALEMLDVLTALNVRDPRMNDALELTCAKQTSNGCWLLENGYNRVQTALEPKGKPSKFVTLRALGVLRRYQP